MADDRAGVHRCGRPRRRAQLGAAVAASVRRRERRAARTRDGEAAGGVGRQAPRRRAAPPDDRRAVAHAEEAGRAPQHVLATLVDAGRRADRRRPHPPGDGLRTARVRGDHRRRARRRRLDRAGPRPAAPAAARRSARLCRLPRGRADADRRHVHLARGRLGADGRADVPRAAASPSPSSRSWLPTSATSPAAITTARMKPSSPPMIKPAMSEQIGIGSRRRGADDQAGDDESYCMALSLPSSKPASLAASSSSVSTPARCSSRSIDSRRARSSFGSGRSAFGSTPSFCRRSRCLLDAEAALGERERPDRRSAASARSAGRRRRAPSRRRTRGTRSRRRCRGDRLPDHGADDRAREPDRDRQPDRHRVRAGDREPRERARPEAGEDDREDEAEVIPWSPSSTTAPPGRGAGS